MSLKKETDMSAQAIRATKVAGWTLIILAIVHTATDIATLLSEPSQQMRAATIAMKQVVIPTSSHSFALFVYGVSFTMALFLAATGSTLLLAARYGRHVPSLIRAMLWLTLVVTVVGVIISILFMPLPPIIGLSVAFIAAAIGLIF